MESSLSTTPTHTASVRIDCAAIMRNLSAIRQHVAGQPRIMQMVKADGYGMGMLELVQTAQQAGVDYFGVAHVFEAAQLRLAGIEEDIFVVGPRPEDAAACVQLKLHVSVSDFDLLEALEQACLELDANCDVHLHLETGMGRFGTDEQQVLAMAERVLQSPRLRLTGLWTHPSCSEDPQMDALTTRQIDRVVSMAHALPAPPSQLHYSNTALCQRFPSHEANVVRVGLGAFGLQGSTACAEQLELEPAVCLSGSLSFIGDLSKGSPVSYGASYYTQRDRSRIAVVSIGYADGVPRNGSGRLEVMIRGRRAPQVGRVAMDTIMVDVTDIPEAAVGDEAILFGKELPAEKLAEAADTIPHDILTRIHPRIPRFWQ